MKKSILIALTTFSLVFSGSTILAAGKGMGGGGPGFENGSSYGDKKQSEMEKEIRERTEKAKGDTKGKTEEERKRIEKEMEKRERKDGDANSSQEKTREQTRTSEEKQAESGKGPAGENTKKRETERKWWQFWK